MFDLSKFFTSKPTISLLTIFFSIYWITTLLNLIYCYRAIKLKDYILKKGYSLNEFYYIIRLENMMIYPLIGILVGLPRTIIRLNFIYDSNYYLSLSQTFCDSLQGFFLAIACLLTFIPLKNDLKDLFIKQNSHLDNSNSSVENLNSSDKETRTSFFLLLKKPQKFYLKYEFILKIIFNIILFKMKRNSIIFSNRTINKYENSELDVKIS